MLLHGEFYQPEGSASVLDNEELEEEDADDDDNEEIVEEEVGEDVEFCLL